MTKAYLEDRNGTKWEINSINRKQKIQIQKSMMAISTLGDTEKFEKLEEIMKQIFLFNYPNATDEEFEDILDYNAETYGFGELYEMIGYIIEDVFTQASGVAKTNPYLEEKRKQKAQTKEEETIA